MENKARKFLLGSSILVCIMCTCIFSFLAMYMDKRSEDAIGRVGQIYMTGMSEQITLHFATTIELRFDSLRGIVNPSYTNERPQREDLIFEGRARGFDYMALCSADGNIEMLYGSQVHITDPEPFLASLNTHAQKVAVGKTVDDKDVVMFGVEAEYEMADGSESIALLAGTPVSYISKTLSLDIDDSMVYSHIIRRDGSFVIHSAGAYRDNYFDRIRSFFDEKDSDEAERCINGLHQAMLSGSEYSMVLDTGEDRRHVYCSTLPWSEWYLITVMPYGMLNQVINDFTADWGRLVLLLCMAILGVLILIFVKYSQLLHQHMKAMEAAQKEALAANRAKSEFLSNMSHDIRTPMNAIVGMTAIAIANIDNQQQVQNSLRKIALSSKHLLGLINDVLDMSKIESGKMTLNVDQVSLREVMDNIVSIVQPQLKMKSQNFNISIHDIEQENVLCDSVRLNQILLNLLSNAIKFTPDGGSVSMELCEEPSPKGEDFVRIHLQVKDTGIGMSPEFKERIFDSFTREDNKRVHKTEGTGLGMTITKYIVDAMQGEISVESEPGVGSEFNVTLDLEKAELQEVDMVLPNLNMLVVDDDRTLCENTVTALESIGLTAEWALDGESAIEMVNQHHAVHNDYAIILLDWKLPGIDGIETARRLRAEMGDDVPILLISAYDWSEIEQEAEAAGINGFISKPLFKSTLFYGLRHYIGQDEAETEETAVHEHKFDFSGKRVLLAEDNDLNWEIANELLSDLGLSLEWAENGQVCVDKFAASPEGYWDAILMDIRMPVMNGYEAADAIRAMDRKDANLPIIAMTADAFAEDISRCLAHGMNAHMAKPIDVDEVARLLEKYLNHGN